MAVTAAIVVIVNTGAGQKNRGVHFMAATNLIIILPVASAKSLNILRPSTVLLELS